MPGRNGSCPEPRSRPRTSFGFHRCSTCWACAMWFSGDLLHRKCDRRFEDRWDAGWQAYLNGRRVPILPTNHALRGVLAPAGAGTLEFRYEPESLTIGLRLSGLAAVVLL